MNRLFVRAAALFAIPLLASGLLTSCGKDPTPPSPPTDVAIVAGDQSMTVTWTMAPDVQYWLYYAPRTSISTSDWMGTDSKVLLNATSPNLITGLTNGQIYSVTIDGRYNGGRAGSGSASVSATPQLAGATWTAGTATGTSDLRGIAYGATFVAAGLGGAMYSSTDGKTWTLLVSNTTSDLNAVVYGGIYVAAGAGGTVVTSSDAVTWTVNPTGNAINALATNGAGYYVAVGAPGGAMYSSGGLTWTAVTTAITNPLYGMAYGVVSSTASFVAVGANGTIVTSADGGINWTAQVSNTVANLTGIAWGTDPTGVSRFVAVGAGGTVVTSADGINWTPQTLAGNPTLNAVTFGHQFIAVGNGGAIYTSTDGLTWQAPTTNPATANLYAIAHNTIFPYGYTAVGAAGANLTAY